MSAFYRAEFGERSAEIYKNEESGVRGEERIPAFRIQLCSCLLFFIPFRKKL